MKACVEIDIRALLDQLIDIVVQCGVEGQRRFVREVFWKDARG